MTNQAIIKGFSAGRRIGLFYGFVFGVLFSAVLVFVLSNLIN